MRIRTNGSLDQTELAIYSRSNGNSNKWEFEIERKPLFTQNGSFKTVVSVFHEVRWPIPPPVPCAHRTQFSAVKNCGKVQAKLELNMCLFLAVSARLFFGSATVLPWSLCSCMKNREWEFGICLLFFRDQMGIRTNESLGPKTLQFGVKWDPICSRIDCTSKWDLIFAEDLKSTKK